MNEPVWTAENQNREKGSTTFKQCGWCKHAGCGSYRYNTMLSGKCELLKSYTDDVEWDTPCKVAKLGKADLNDIVRSKEYNIKESKRAIERTREEIKTLEALVKVADPIPALPDSRECTHFPVNAPVRVFLEKQEKVPKTDWYSGTTVNGYRTHDGCVSYVLDGFPESQKGWGCGMSVPIVLNEKEFQYFKKHPTQWLEWLSLADREYNGKKMPITLMYNALLDSN